MASRCITIKTWPKRPEDKQSFDHVDDDTFAELRRKLARWSADNAVALKDARPLYPAGFNNRLAVNWRLLLAIAELAGGEWPKQARRPPSASPHGPQDELWRADAASVAANLCCGRAVIPSREVVAVLTADPDSAWCEFNHGGAITQRQVAAVLEPYEIHPIVIHLTRRSSSSPRGYKREQFHDVFARFLAHPDPHIRTQSRKRERK